jgi:hypothetical protein
MITHTQLVMNSEKFCFNKPCACISLQIFLYEFWDFYSGVAADSYPLGYDTASQEKLITDISKERHFFVFNVWLFQDL